MPGGADPDIDAGCRDEHPGRYLDDNARSNPRRQDVWLRLDLARERGVPAYVGFPGRTLIDMVRRRPRSEAEFAVRPDRGHGVATAPSGQRRIMR